MNLPAESLLMVVGLLKTPDKDDFRAAVAVQPDLQREIKELLDLDEPKKLRFCPERKTYFDRLSDDPDYDEITAPIAAAMGQETADAFRALHTNARAALIESYPKMTVSSIVSSTVLPNDPISAGRWLIDVDVIEGMRLLRDMASGALLRSSVAIFKDAFPGTYQELRLTLDENIGQRLGRKKSWQPATWMHASLSVFEEQPFGAKLEIKGVGGPAELAAKAPATGASAGKSGLKDIVAGLRTPVGSVR